LGLRTEKIQFDSKSKGPLLITSENISELLWAFWEFVFSITVFYFTNLRIFLNF